MTNIFLTGHLDEHSRNAVMGHQKGGTFAHYISVQDDTQSIFMGTPTRDSLVNLAIHANLKRDPSAPRGLSNEQKNIVEMEGDLQELKSAYESLKGMLVAEFGQLKKAKEINPPRWRECQSLYHKVSNRRRKLQKKAYRAARAQFFKDIGNEIIERNHQGNPITFTPDTSHIQPERRALANLEFKNRDADILSDAEMLEDRIRSLELRLELNRLHIPKALKNQIKFDIPSRSGTKEKTRWKHTEKAGAENDTSSVKSSTGLECPVCLGNESLHPLARNYVYARKDVLKRHFETHRLPFIFNRYHGRQCDYPGCMGVLFTLAEYKLHLEDCHLIKL